MSARNKDMDLELESETGQWTLEQVIERLKQHPDVTGILLIGSFQAGRGTLASDYDLVIVLADTPAPWYVGVTRIDGRLADLLFVADAEVQKTAALEDPVAFDHSLAPVIRWLKDGQILFDRTGQIQAVHDRLQDGKWVQGIDDRAVYAAWFAMNFNLAHAERMRRSEDPLYRHTLAIRLAVYGPPDLWFGYFTIRRIPWEGDKAAVQYLLEHDPSFLTALEAFITTVEMDQKLERYRAAAALAAAPLGGLWGEHQTVMNIPDASQTWRRLVGMGEE